MFKLNEEFLVKGVRIRRGWEFDDGTYERAIIFEPFNYVSKEEDGEMFESFEMDFLGCEISENFDKQEELITKKIEESKNNIKERRLLYSIKSLKKMIAGEKVRTAGNHQLVYVEGKRKYFKDKYGEIDIEYISCWEKTIGEQK